MSKNKRNAFILIALIITCLSVVLSLLAIIFLSFNIIGAADLYGRIIHTYISQNIDIGEQITMFCIDSGLSVLINIYFASFYIRAFRAGVENRQLGRLLISQGIFQMILASFLAGIFALIGGIVMNKKYPEATPIMQEDTGNSEVKTETDYQGDISKYKLEAMKEAVERLKELRAKGIISEEEFYINLNKILEG